MELRLKLLERSTTTRVTSKSVIIFIISYCYTQHHTYIYCKYGRLCMVLLSERFGIIKLPPPPPPDACTMHVIVLVHVKLLSFAMVSKRKRVSSYTMEFKLKVISRHRNNGGNKHANAQYFGIDRKRIRNWM